LNISSDKIIFVDNDPNNEERRESSRKLLLEHLTTCQEIYQPKNLEKLNEILRKDNDEEEVKEELEKYYQQEEQKSKINSQINELEKKLKVFKDESTGLVENFINANKKIIKNKSDEGAQKEITKLDKKILEEKILSEEKIDEVIHYCEKLVDLE
jgi:hypothetical protein